MFRKTYTIKRNTGKYIKGVYTITAIEEIEVILGVQPLTGYEAIQLQQQGRKTAGSVKVYSDNSLRVGVDGEENTGDVFIWNGKKYEIVAHLEYDNNILNHNKYIAEYRNG